MPELRNPVKRRGTIAKKYLTYGRLTKPGSEVERFVRNVIPNLNQKPTLQQIKNLATAIFRIPKKEVNREQLRTHYAKRSAEQILKDNTALHSRYEDGAPRIGGCVDKAHVAASCLRRLGIPTIFVRRGTHSFVEFEYEGEIYYLDLHNKTEIVGKAIQTDKEEHHGLDADEIGLNHDTYYKPPLGKVSRSGT